ncbi:MAG: hypothetical protein ACM359_21415, partial [Bacillota bacterium]
MQLLQLTEEAEEAAFQGGFVAVQAGEGVGRIVPVPEVVGQDLLRRQGLGQRLGGGRGILGFVVAVLTLVVPLSLLVGSLDIEAAVVVFPGEQLGFGGGQAAQPPGEVDDALGQGQLQGTAGTQIEQEGVG